MSAENVDDALAALRSGSWNVLVLDWLPPFEGKQGAELVDWDYVYRTMKAEPVLRTVGIVLLTPYITWASKDVARRFYSRLDAQGDCALLKPVVPEALLAAVEAVLTRHGNSLPTEEERRACLEKNRGRLKEIFNLSDEELEEKQRTWVARIQADGTEC